MILIDYIIYLYYKFTHKKIDYNKYLNSNHWQRTRLKAIKKARFKCQICGYRGNYEIHHNNYDCLYREKYSDIICICGYCHEIIHKYKFKNIKEVS